MPSMNMPSLLMRSMNLPRMSKPGQDLRNEGLK